MKRLRIREKSLEIKKRSFDIYLLIKASSSLSNSIEQVFKKVKKSLKIHSEEVRAQVLSLSCQVLGSDVLECKAKKILLCISRAKCVKKLHTEEFNKPQEVIFLSFVFRSWCKNITHLENFFEIFRGVL